MRGEGSMKNRMQDLDFEQTLAFDKVHLPEGQLRDSAR